jgi:hypothetical protein
MNNDIDDLNDLVDALNNTKSVASVLTPPTSMQLVNNKPEVITDTNIDDFIFRKSSEIIQNSLDVVATIKNNISSSGTPEDVDAYAKLITSVTKSIEILNKINIQKRKDAAAKELKQMSIDADNKKLQANSNVNMIGTQNNVIVATRDEALKAFGMASNKLLEDENIVVVDDVIDV